MLDIVIIFLSVSLLLYMILGGADFGAGIIELFAGKRFKDAERAVISGAIGPVWEANHMWLIIVVVILFMGFPRVYTDMSIYLHIPLTLTLMGIIARGTAFTFRHYDAIKDESQEVYSFIFKFSSLWTAFFLGVLTGAMALGKINPEAAGFYDGYIAPWLNIFCVSTGIFACCVFAFLASVFLIGETTDVKMKDVFVRVGTYANIATVISGGLVFLAGLADGFDLFASMLDTPASIAGMILATLSLPVLWYALRKEKVILSRLTAGFQASMILISWYAINFPYILKRASGNDLSLLDTAAPPATIAVLGYALLIGSTLIFPFLYYLFRIFKLKKSQKA